MSPVDAGTIEVITTAEEPTSQVSPRDEHAVLKTWETVERESESHTHQETHCRTLLSVAVASVKNVIQDSDEKIPLSRGCLAFLVYKAVLLVQASSPRSHSCPSVPQQSIPLTILGYTVISPPFWSAQHTFPGIVKYRTAPLSFRAAHTKRKREKIGFSGL